MSYGKVHFQSMQCLYIGERDSMAHLGTMNSSVLLEFWNLKEKLVKMSLERDKSFKSLKFLFCSIEINALGALDIR